MPTRIYSQTLIAAIMFLSFMVKGECVTAENRNTPSHASWRQKIIDESNYTDATRIAAKTSSMLLLSICFKNTTVGDEATIEVYREGQTIELTTVLLSREGIILE